MKIGFDGKRTTQNFTGLGNYGRYVLNILTKYYPANHYSVYALKAPAEGLIIPHIQYKYPGKRSIKSFWRTYGIVKNLCKDEIDLFHGLSNEIPLNLKKSGIASIVTIHDLIFLRYPQYYSYIDRKIYELKFRYAASRADKVIAISEQTKRDLIDYFEINEDRIKVIYQNCDPLFHQKKTNEDKLRIRLKYNLPGKYLLNVGTIETRKNLMIIAEALKDLENIHLVIVGKETPYALKVKEFVKNNGLTDRVHFLKDVSFDDLPGIYQLSEIFIYPSRFEGFGIPVVEALHSGVPVIAAKGSCLEEAGGPGSIYIDPDDKDDLAENIKDLLNNYEKKEVMIQSGYEHLKNFEDQKIAAEIMQLYQNVIGNA